MISLMVAAASGSDPTAIFASYGAAAPLLGLMYVFMRVRVSDAQKRAEKAEARAEKAEARSDELTERMLTQQAQTIPVLVEATSVIRATGSR